MKKIIIILSFLLSSTLYYNVAAGINKDTQVAGYNELYSNISIQVYTYKGIDYLRINNISQYNIFCVIYINAHIYYKFYVSARQSSPWYIRPSTEFNWRCQ